MPTTQIAPETLVVCKKRRKRSRTPANELRKTSPAVKGCKEFEIAEPSPAVKVCKEFEIAEPSPKFEIAQPSPAVRDRKELEIGQPFNILQFLSSKDCDYLFSPKDGTISPISCLRDKYVLVCCFLDSPNSIHPGVMVAQPLQALYHEHTRMGDDPPFKLVFIFNFERDEDENEDAFNAFYRNLSLDCLAVPFSESKSRRLIADSLSPGAYSDVSTLVLNPYGLVLQNTPYLLYKYGAQSFPFTNKHFNAITKRDDNIKLQFCSPHSRISLPGLLECESLFPIDRASNSYNSVSLLSLVDKTVCLYLYYDGSLMNRLHRVYEKCQKKSLELHIVLVPMPFQTLDPDSFCKEMKQAALKSKPAFSWLLFPYTDKICRTLSRITSGLIRDEVIVLPCGERVGELEGGHMVRLYGIKAYPFTRDAMVDKKVNHLRSRTLESLLGDDNIRNKKVLLYFGYDICMFEYLYYLMEEESAKIKHHYPDALLFFASLGRRAKFDGDCFLGMKILSDEQRNSVVKHVFMKEDHLDESFHETLVAFGEDGKILSRLAHSRLPLRDYPFGSIFEDTLRQEIRASVESRMIY